MSEDPQFAQACITFSKTLTKLSKSYISRANLISSLIEFGKNHTNTFKQSKRIRKQPGRVTKSKTPSKHVLARKTQMNLLPLKPKPSRKRKHNLSLNVSDNVPSAKKQEI